MNILCAVTRFKVIGFQTMDEDGEYAVRGSEVCIRTSEKPENVQVRPGCRHAQNLLGGTNTQQIPKKPRASMEIQDY